MLVAGLPYPMGGGGTPTPTPGSSGTLRIASGSVASDLTDFPVRVDLARMPAGFWTGTNNGEDLRFFSGATELPTDLVYCDTGSEAGEIWVLVPLVDADANTDITWSVDGTSTRPAAIDSNGMNAVWADYEYVGIPHTDFSDRTGKNTLQGLSGGGSRSYGAPTGGNSQYAGGGAATVSNQKMGYSVSDPAGVFTLSASYLTNDDSQDCVVSLNNSYAGGGNRVNLVNDNGNNFGLWDNSNSWLYCGFNPDTTNWNRVTGKHNGATQRKLICNAVNVGIDNTVSSMTGFASIWLGASSSSAEYLSGKIGWTYLRAEYLSDDWITAEHEMMADNTFCDAV